MGFCYFIKLLGDLVSEFRGSRIIGELLGHEGGGSQVLRFPFSVVTCGPFRQYWGSSIECWFGGLQLCVSTVGGCWGEPSPFAVWGQGVTAADWNWGCRRWGCSLELLGCFEGWGAVHCWGGSPAAPGGH